MSENIDTPDPFARAAALDKDTVMGAVVDVLSLAAYWDTLADGDKHYAKQVRRTISDALNREGKPCTL